MANSRKDLLKRAHLAAYLGRNATRCLACLSDRAIDLLVRLVQSRCSPTFAEAMIIHSPFCRSNSPGTVVDCTSATWLKSGCAPVLLLTGMVWISLSEVISVEAPAPAPDNSHRTWDRASNWERRSGWKQWRKTTAAPTSFAVVPSWPASTRST